MYYKASTIAILALLVLVVLLVFCIIPEAWFEDVYSDRDEMTRGQFWAHTFAYGGLLLSSLILGFGMIMLMMSY